MNRALRSLRSAAFGAGAAALLLVSGLSPASAHVNLNAETTAAGSSGLLRFSFSHGCDGSATTEIAIAIPEGVTSVAPGMNYGWTVEKVTDDSATPAAGDHGSSAPVTEVVYTAKEPVEDGFYDEMVLRVGLADDIEGETLYFPVIQTCQEGESAWIEIPAEGESGDELEYPAPSMTVTAPEENGGH
jgi:uncharacterized protein YcnI